MTQLTTDLSDPLLALLGHDPTLVDAVEVGPWFSVERIRQYRQFLPDLPFHLHGGDLLTEVGAVPGAVGRIAAYVAAAGSPWVSLHLCAWRRRQLGIMLRQGWRLPIPSAGRALRRVVEQVQRLQEALAVPLLLENVEPLPWPGYDWHAQPDTIREVVARTGCALLLDTGHARIAAAALGMTAQDYVRALPLVRVRQVHASGPRERAGRLVDAHEPLSEEDYTLLTFVLTRTQLNVLTLEYIREGEALRAQLVLLRAISRAG
jgi:uncharacterized protein